MIGVWESPRLFDDPTFTKDQFLQSLRAASSGKYKRYVGSPLRYSGGKSLAVGLIVEHIPEHVSRVVSPFIGGGSLEVALAKEMGLEVIGYDIFDILVTYWQTQLSHPRALYNRLEKFQPTTQCFDEVKAILKQHWKGEKLLHGADLAAHYYFNHNTSYGPNFLGWPSSVYMDKDRYASMIEKVRTFRAPTLSVECASFEDTIPKHQGDFLYLDPPYYLGGDSKMFIGMYPHRNFPVHHKGFNHELLAQLLREHTGGFILSYNDCTPIRELYEGFRMETPSWQYTYGQGETRIGKNREGGFEEESRAHVKESHELLILG
jgi:DNA adenine methylase